MPAGACFNDLTHFGWAGSECYGLHRCCNSLRRRQQNANLRLHRLERFHQSAHIHRTNSGGMQNQAAFHGQHAHAEQELLPDQAGGQLGTVFGRMYE